jgi:hypothetical protein
MTVSTSPLCRRFFFLPGAYARLRMRTISPVASYPSMRVWVTILVLFAVLAMAIYVGYIGWNLTDVAIPPTGYVAMTLGIVFSLLIGGGLMALMFYSSRHGYDEPPSEPPKQLSRRRHKI